jgi:outer membrane protein OmpA-like peptidoglycan-associated protein
MKKLLYGFSALLLGACAATSEQSSMSPAELADCLQPNRRVVVEIVGLVAKPPAKKPAAKPQEAGAAPKSEAAEAKPAPKSEAAEAKPAAKPAKPQFAPFEQSVYVQGNSAFDPSSAVLKDEGKKEIDKALAAIKKRAVRVNAIIVSGHTDRLEASSAAKSLSEERAKAVKDYLVSQGADEKAIFWEGKEASVPVPVTKFCS